MSAHRSPPSLMLYSLASVQDLAIWERFDYFHWCFLATWEKSQVWLTQDYVYGSRVGHEAKPNSSTECSFVKKLCVHPETSSRITTLVSPAQLLFPLTGALFIQMKWLLSESWMLLVSGERWTCCKSRWSHLFLPGLILIALKASGSVVTLVLKPNYVILIPGHATGSLIIAFT